RLLEYPDIKDVVVIVMGDEGSDKYLTAYLVRRRDSDGSIDHQGLRDYLSRTLPDYMIPSYFMELDKIPLTPNGKVDRRALPEPAEGETKQQYSAPENETQEQLAGLWAELLNREAQTIGIDDHFFKSGGHSLKATILVSRINKRFNVKVSFADIFDALTIRELSGIIESKTKTLYESIPPVEKKEYYPQSSAQKRLFFLDRFEGIGTGYNIPLFLNLHGSFDIHRCERAFLGLIQRHESLRTSFHMIDNQPVQRVHDHVELEIEFFFFF
ncbi:MAG: hypothetical protein GY940_03715, partial [bacterium]|nr:hypothetical protein [bacterium]